MISKPDPSIVLQSGFARHFSDQSVDGFQCQTWHLSPREPTEIKQTSPQAARGKRRSGPGVHLRHGD